MSTRFIALAWLTLIACVETAASGLSAASPPAGDTIGINATPTDDPHVLELSRRFVPEGLVVRIISRAKPSESRDLARGRDYMYDPVASKVALLGDVAVDDRNELLLVSGALRDPSEFLFHQRLSPGSVKVLLGDRRLVEGKGFEVDEAEGIVRILDPEIRTPDASYYIQAAGHALGNRSDSEKIRRLLDEPSRVRKERPSAPPGETVGTNATPTRDPHVFELTQRFASKGLVVRIISRAKPTEGHDLVRGRDYTYDSAPSKVVLLGDVTVDDSKELLCVIGTVQDPSVFLFHQRLAPGSVKVLLGDRRLVEGKGFKVDEAEGVVRILDPEIRTPNASYYLQAGGHSFGNMSDSQLLRRLLDEPAPARK